MWKRLQVGRTRKDVSHLSLPIATFALSALALDLALPARRLLAFPARRRLALRIITLALLTLNQLLGRLAFERLGQHKVVVANGERDLVGLVVVHVTAGHLHLHHLSTLAAEQQAAGVLREADAVDWCL